MGTITPRQERKGHQSVHPHGRGDNGVPAGVAAACFGSPPRAWGQCEYDIRERIVRRFTPTGVGTIPSRRRILISRPVHPHRRGDNWLRPRNLKDRSGSPPRAWGQCRFDGRYVNPCRFTPTGVGTMRTTSTERDDRTVHPHGRGDNQQTITGAATAIGSPPRAWGQSRSEGNPPS